MRTNSRRRDQGLILAVLTVVFSLPELALAQQGRPVPTGADQGTAGPVRPGRSDLQDLQAPIFWLSPDVLAGSRTDGAARAGEAPNKEKAFKDIPLLSGKDENLETMPEEGAPEGNQPGRTPQLAQSASQRTFAFRDGQARRGSPSPSGRTAPNPDDPFEARKVPRQEPADRGPALRTHRSSDVPDLAAPADQPAPSQGAPVARSDDESRPASDEVEEEPCSHCRI